MANLSKKILTPCMSLEDSGQKSMLLLSTEYKGPLVNDAIYNGTLAYAYEDDESVLYEMKLQRIFSESMQISGSFQNITYRSTEVHLPLEYCSLERFKSVYKILP